VILDGKLVLQVLSFNTVRAASAETAVELVVVVLAVRLVVENVELGRRKRLGARCADKAGLVVFSCQSSIR
jgi:hypothetical protein